MSAESEQLTVCESVDGKRIEIAGTQHALTLLSTILRELLADPKETVVTATASESQVSICVRRIDGLFSIRDAEVTDEAADRKTIEVMARFGGGFVKQLAEAARHADRDNLKRLKNAFPGYWADYAKKHDWLPNDE